MKTETNPFSLLQMQVVIDDVLDWINEHERSFFDGVRTAEELTDKLLLVNPIPKDWTITRETVVPLVANWWKEGTDARRAELNPEPE